MNYTVKDLILGARKMAHSVFGKKDEYTISFTKEDDGLGYVDFPGGPFDHHNLLMVAGADKLCELLSYDGKHTKVSVRPTNKRLPYCQSTKMDDYFELVKKDSGLTEGATYQINLNAFKAYGAHLWLCPVTLFVLGKYPKYMYVKKLEG